MSKLTKIFVIIFSSIIGIVFILIMNYDNFTGDGESQTELKVKGSDSKERYFKRWHEPLGSILEPGQIKKMWDEVHSMPSEQNDFPNSENWSLLGPWGSMTYSNVLWTGRVLDIKLFTDSSMIIGSSSGGMWKTTNGLPEFISEGVLSPSISTFDVQPGNPNLIVAGTATTVNIFGTGIWRTTNGGVNWTNITLDPPTNHCYKIRFSPGSQNIVHAATKTGYYRSTDAGLTWTRILDNDVTDICINPHNIDFLYLGRRDHPNIGGIGGIYKSTNGGLNWTRLDNNGLPVTNLGKSVITIAASAPMFAYALIIKDIPSSQMLGMYKTIDYGANWTAITLPEDILGGGATSSTGVIGVCPANSQILVAGGLWLWVTNNGGTTWDKVTDQDEPSIHADIHSIAWDSLGNSVAIGHDGGTSFTPHREVYYFSSYRNTWPVTEYYNFDVGISNNNIIWGGSQDNSFTGTTDGGVTWKYTRLGPADGGGMAIDPLNAANVYGSVGLYSGELLFHRHKSTNFGQNWSEFSTGLSNGTNWAPKISTDNLAPINVYTYSGNNFYTSTNGVDWTQMNMSAFAYPVANFSIRDYLPDITKVIYLCLDNNTNPERLKVKVDNSDFIERTNGIPDNISIRGVSMHPTNENIAIALINGFSEGNKMFITTDKGVQWTNISGNLPNVPMGDLVIHPQDEGVYYLGTEMGCYKTINGGSNWFRWNDGMTQTAIVTEMKWYANNNDLYILAGTYGRGIWKRKDTDNPLPVQLASFSSSLNGRDVRLTWKTESEINNTGFDVERSVSGLNQWAKAGYVAGKGNSNIPVNYTFDDKKLNNGKYNYRLKQIDNNGNFEYHVLSNIVEVGLPTKFELSQNYPNPFNPTTKIDFSLPFDSKLTIKLYDVSGREVRTLVNDTRTAGYYTVEFNASDLSSGIYFYRILTKSSGADYIMTKKMVVVK